MKHRAALFAAVVAAFAAASRPARADDPPDDELLSGEAAKLFEQARAALNAGAFGECFAKAKAAWLLERRLKVAALAGDCGVQVGRFREAAEDLAYYLAYRPATAKPALVAHAEEQLAKARAKVAHVVLDMPTEPTELTLDGAPLDMPTLFLDGAGKKQPPRYHKLSLYLEPGSHRFDAKRDNYTPASVTRDFAAGSDGTLAIELVAIPVPVPEPVPKQPGNWIGYAPGGAVLGVGAVALGIGAALLVVAAGKTDDALNERDALRVEAGGSSQCSAGGGVYADRCEAIADKLKAHDTFANAGRGLLAVGAVGAAVGVALLGVAAASQPASETESRVDVIPMVSPVSAGIGVLGNF